MNYIRTEAHRAAQSEAIRRWKPWERSSGPQTVEGKARSAKRGFKGGMRSELRLLAKLLRQQAKALCSMSE